MHQQIAGVRVPKTMHPDVVKAGITHVIELEVNAAEVWSVEQTCETTAGRDSVLPLLHCDIEHRPKSRLLGTVHVAPVLPHELLRVV